MHMPFTHIIAVIVFCATAVTAIPPPRLPLHQPIHEEPDLLTEYERKTLKIELSNLTSEITKARLEAAKAPSLEAERQALQTARKERNSQQITTAKRELAESVEALLLTQEDMPGKLKRLLEVGHLLEYDTQFQKDERRRKGTRYKRLRNQSASPESHTKRPPPAKSQSAQ